jgi:hypothetical protein
VVTYDLVSDKFENDVFFQVAIPLCAVGRRRDQVIVEAAAVDHLGHPYVNTWVPLEAPGANYTYIMDCYLTVRI